MHVVVAFYVCYFDEETKESEGGNAPLPPLATPLMRDPGA